MTTPLPCGIDNDLEDYPFGCTTLRFNVESQSQGSSFFSTIYLDGEKIFPGLNALLPCFGAFFVIYCSGQTKYDYFF